MFVFSIAVLACFPVATTTITAAFFHHEHYVSSAARPPVPQFQSWYPNHNKALLNLTHTTCNATYADYLTAYNAPRGSRDASYLRSTCYAFEGCLLSAVPDNWQANFNSALVMLGLMPTLLANIGPSLAEVSLLSAHRPVLSFLISMGASAIYPSRVFEYTHPTEILTQRPRLLRISQMPPWRATMLSLAQYIVAVVAIANVITTSIEAGRKSILTVGCTVTFAPLLWSSSAFVIHLVSVLSYFVARKRALRRMSMERLSLAAMSPEMQENSKEDNSEQMESKSLQTTASSIPPRPIYRVWLSWLRVAWLSETTICANRSKSHKHQESRAESPVATLLGVAAGLLSFLHITLGTLFFSSLQFVTVNDVLKQILWRYIASSAACRLLLITEISGLRSNAEAGDLEQVGFCSTQS